MNKLLTNARLAGACYLAIIALGLLGEMVVRGSLVVSGDPAATANTIASAQGLWRLGIGGDVLMHVLDVPVMIFFYLLLKPVNQGLALLATGFNIVQTAVLVANKMTLLVPLFLLQDAGYLAAFSPAQLHVVAYLAVKAHGYGFGIGLIFFGLTCLVRGYLMVVSTYFPRALGILLIVAGVCYLVNSFALLLAPAIASLLFPAILLPAFVAELSLALWLVVKGVRTPRETPAT